MGPNPLLSLIWVKRSSIRHFCNYKYVENTRKVWWVSGLTSIVTISWFSIRTGTSVDDGKAHWKDLTWFLVPNLTLCHWSSQLFNLCALSSTDVPVLLLNQLIVQAKLRFNNKRRWDKYQGTAKFIQNVFLTASSFVETALHFNNSQ